MYTIPNPPLLYVGKNGGCIIVEKYRDLSGTIEVHFANKNFTTSSSNFFSSTYDFEPDYFTITHENRHHIENLGLPLIQTGENKFEIPEIFYQGLQNLPGSGGGSFWFVSPFLTHGSLFFKLFQKTKSQIFISPRRMEEGYVETATEVRNKIKPMTKEELKEFIRRNPEFEGLDRIFATVD